VIIYVRTPYRVDWSRTPRTFEVGSPPITSFTLTGFVGGNDPIEEREMSLHVYGSAEFERDGSEWKLLRIVVEKSLPGEQDYDALAAAEIRDEVGPSAD
jgi:hypothetical protein